MIRLYLKISEKFVRLILQDRCLVVHIPFVCIVNFQYLAQLSGNHLAHSVVSSLILFFSANFLHSLIM